MSVVTLAEAKTHLGISVATYDTELQSFIDAAEAIIAERCGPLTATSQTARIAGYTDTLVLPVTPVVSLTSVTPVNGSALTLSDLYVYADSGLVVWNTSSWFGADYYTVVYSAGRSSVPTDLKHGIKELIRHLWKSQRGSGVGRPGTGGGSDDIAPVPGFLMPYAVAEIIAPHIQPGFA